MLSVLKYFMHQIHTVQGTISVLSVYQVHFYRFDDRIAEKLIINYVTKLAFQGVRFTSQIS